MAATIAQMEFNSGGVGAVSAGISESLVFAILLVLIILTLLGVWKLAKIVWAMFSGG